MAATRKNQEPDKKRRPPATTPEARENQMISLAVDLAEKQMRDGTASSQLITHYLKLATTREKLEQQKIAGEIELRRAQVDSMASAKDTEALYKNALNAMRSYSGQDPIEEEYEE